jgi:radical SAM superfamily enzyme YgiQ (UPF0313 family)
MTDVLYIHPIGENPSFSKKYFNEKNKNNSLHYFGFIPMGIIGIVNNLLKNGITVRGINLPLKKRVDPKFDLIRYLTSTKPKIVLIDMHWHVHLKHGIEIAKLCKKHLDCTIIVGGISATLFYKELLQISEIDYVVKGDSEKPLLELIRSLLRANDTSLVANVSSRKFDNPITYRCTDIDEYDYVSLDFLEDNESYVSMFDFWIMVGKGCPFNCENCDGRHGSRDIFGKNRALLRTPEKVICDLQTIKSETVGFSLDFSMFPDEFIERLSMHTFDMNLRNEFFQLPDMSKVRKIKGSFRSFDLVLSPDFGDEDERRRNGKKFSNEEFLKALRELSDEDITGGIIIYFTDMILSPKEVIVTDKRARDNLIKEIKKISPDVIIEILPWVADPGTLKGKMDSEELFRYYLT